MTIHLVQRSWSDGRYGKASALNFGMRKAKGEIILCFDADYYPQKDIVEKLVKTFADPKVGAVQGRVVVLNEPKNSRHKNCCPRTKRRVSNKTGKLEIG